MDKVTQPHGRWHHVRQFLLYLLDRLGHVVWRLWRHHARSLTIVVLGLLLVFGTGILLLRYWILPDIDQYRPRLVQTLSQTLGQPVSIGSISADWVGLRPRLVLHHLQIRNAAGQPSLSLDSAHASLSWWSVPTFSVRFASIALNRPVLQIRLDRQGRLWLGDVWLNQPGTDSGVADWVLQQGRIQVSDASIAWIDEQHGTQPVRLEQATLRLLNRGSRHRLGLVAQVPGLTPVIDVRADLRGTSLQQLQDWRGTVYARFTRLRIADLQARLPLKLPLTEGEGAMQAWLELSKGRLVAAEADVRVQNVRGQLGQAAPFDLLALNGRVGWGESDGTLRYHSRQLALQMRNGIRLAPTTFSITLKQPGNAATQGPAGELTANRLDAQELLRLVPYVPIPAALQDEIRTIAPSGRIEGVFVSWEGSWPQLQKYSLKARFVGAGVAALGKLPGVRGVSGSLEASDKGGSLILDSRASTLHLPLVFRQPLAFDRLRANVSWEKVRENTQVKITQVSFENPALAGKVVGSYLVQPGSEGSIDLTGNLFRADARYVHEYLPLIINADALHWLDQAFLAGHSKDVFVRLKGPLQHFPFADGKSGQFLVKARVDQGKLYYGEGWPELEKLVANLQFSGARMQVDLLQGEVLGAQLEKASAIIPDLMNGNEQLLVHGEAAGQLQSLLDFVEHSPVRDMTSGFTIGMQGGGSAKLALDLDMPLRHSIDTAVRGAVLFNNNSASFASAIPPLEKIQGKLEFDEHGIASRDLRLEVVGGPARINIATEAGVVKVAAAGRASGTGLQRYLAVLPAGVLSGETGWKGSFSIHDNSSIRVESSLQGLAIKLPSPYGKAASAALPFYLSMNQQSGQAEEWGGRLGQWGGARFSRPADGAVQGVIQLGSVEPVLQRDGIWLQGELPAFDLDAWRRLKWPQPAASASDWQLAGASLKFRQLDAGGRRFADLSVDGRRLGNEWQASLNGRDMSGQVSWSGENNGRLVGRFKRFTVPAAVEAASVTGIDATGDAVLPVLDLAADRFEAAGRPLGRMELLAHPVGKSWNIDRLSLTASDYVLAMQGVWDQSRRPHRTSAQISLDVKDVGSFLSRFGFDGAVKRGAARLNGQVGWQDEPTEIDYASMSGQLRLDAEKGQFLKIEPGVGKLLGILSLQALPRRITLDFRDVFSEGFAFDAISGDLRINKGILATDNFQIAGPAARIEMRGTTDLARETQDLRLYVQPTLTDSVSLAGAFLGGPAVGVASYVLQKVLRNPVEKIIAYEYHVGGSWTDPVVSRAKQPVGAPAEGFKEN